jgi:glyoxylase-like metal-dependent hydrolase (beta-lactamase superfamily II)
MARDRDLGVGERVMPGLWRLRMTLPFAGVPHCNAWAVRRGSGIVLFDTGMHWPGSIAQLERAIGDTGRAIEQVELVAITHAHQDHWGQAATVQERAGCEVWMHPNHAHATDSLRNPEAALERALEVGRQSGVSEAALARYAEDRRELGPGIAGIVEPARPLIDGVEVDTDLGPWVVYETPGHAPSHVCFYQPERRLLISGDHLLGRISLFFEYGASPDPVGEFLRSLSVIEPLDVRLCLSGHGRTFTDLAAHVAGNRQLVGERLDAALGGLRERPRPAAQLVGSIFGEVPAPMASWRLTETLCYLRHLESEGQARHEPHDGVEQWHGA